MIKPASYWAMHKTCDPYTLGRVAVTLGGQTVDPPLAPAEMALVEVVRADSRWMDERIDAERERWKERQRKSRMSRNVTVTNGDTDVSRKKCQCHDTSLPPSLPPSVPPTENTNRSVTVPLGGGERNGTETERDKFGGDGEKAARKASVAVYNAILADSGAIFDPALDPALICATITGDFKSVRRWRQLVKAKGDIGIREEAYAFYRELAAGESVVNRGAALNDRLGNLPARKPEGAEA